MSRDLDLPRDFIIHPEKMAANTQSGHGVIFGARRDGVSVALKPFMGGDSYRQRINQARSEHRMYRLVAKLGYSTFISRGVLQEGASVFLETVYVPGLMPATAIRNPGEQTPEGVHESNEPTLFSAVTAISSVLSDLHRDRVTHGDAKLRNFMFRRRDGFGPLVVDLEGTQQHGATSKAQEFFDNAKRNDLGGFAFNLGTQGYGGSFKSIATQTLEETVVEPYVQANNVSLSTFTADRIFDSFQLGRKVYFDNQGKLLSQQA